MNTGKPVIFKFSFSRLSIFLAFEFMDKYGYILRKKICIIHKMLLEHRSKDIRHRGEYKKMPNHVEAFSHDGKSLGVIFKKLNLFHLRS